MSHPIQMLLNGKGNYSSAGTGPGTVQDDQTISSNFGNAAKLQGNSAMGQVDQSGSALFAEIAKERQAAQPAAPAATPAAPAAPAAPPPPSPDNTPTPPPPPPSFTQPAVTETVQAAQQQERVMAPSRAQTLYSGSDYTGTADDASAAAAVKSHEDTPKRQRRMTLFS